MEKSEIIEQLKELRTAGNLASLLDAIKQDEFGKVRYEISEKMLKHFSSDKIAPKRFRTFHIRKKSGGLREIKAPCRQLDVILTCVNVMLKAVYEPSDSAMGFTSGKSVLTNAQVHVGKNYVFNIDLKDFFPSIPQARVWKRLQLAPFNFTREVASVLAGLCCTHDDAADANVLPQGSPASPLLTNAICDNLDRRMRGVAKRFGLHYTRYADDMTFSSMHNVYQEGSEFRQEIQRIIVGQGFRMNESKTRLQKAGSRQEVTGLTVNSIANVSRKKYISDVRWILHVWEKEGYAKAYALFYPKYKHDKGYIKKGEPVMENVVGGKLEYLRMVRGANNPAYKKLAARFAALQEVVFVDNETDKKKSYVYVQPYKMSDFQTLFHTEVSLEISREDKLIGKCVIDGREKFLSISKSTQEVLRPKVEAKLAGDVVSPKELEDCFVTLCRNKGKNFWLITQFEPKRSRCLSIQNAAFDIDELLDIWEQEGFDSAVAALGHLLEHGTLESFKKVTATRKDALMFVRFFTHRKNLTTVQKARLDRLFARDCVRMASTVKYNDLTDLLEIWERDGLNAAVKEWKARMSSEKSRATTKKRRNTIEKQKNTARKNGVRLDAGDFVELPDVVEELSVTDISIEELKAAQGDIFKLPDIIEDVGVPHFSNEELQAAQEDLKKGGLKTIKTVSLSSEDTPEKI